MTIRLSGGINTPTKIVLPRYPNRAFYGPTVFNNVCTDVHAAVASWCSELAYSSIEELGHELDEAACIDVEESIELP